MPNLNELTESDLINTITAITGGDYTIERDCSGYWAAVGDMFLSDQYASELEALRGLYRYLVS